MVNTWSMTEILKFWGVNSCESAKAVSWFSGGVRSGKQVEISLDSAAV